MTLLEPLKLEHTLQRHQSISIYPSGENVSTVDSGIL